MRVMLFFTAKKRSIVARAEQEHQHGWRSGSLTGNFSWDLLSCMKVLLVASLLVPLSSSKKWGTSRLLFRELKVGQKLPATIILLLMMRDDPYAHGFRVVGKL